MSDRHRSLQIALQLERERFLWRAAALTTVQPHPVDAQPASPAHRIAAGIEGRWFLGFPNEAPTSQHLASVLAGGVALATNAPTFEEAELGGRASSMEGHGAWAALGSNRYAFTLVSLYVDGGEENLVSLTVEGVVALAGVRDRVSGTDNLTVTTPDGMPVFSEVDQPITGTRIRPPA